MVPRPPKYQHFGTPKAAKQWCWGPQVTAARSLPLCHSSYVTPADADANDSINQWFGQAKGLVPSLQSLWPLGLCIRKNSAFATQIQERPNMTITHYLQYKTSVFMVPKPPKYQYFGTQKPAKQWSWCWCRCRCCCWCWCWCRCGLQYKTFVFMVPRPPKYQYLGTPIHH